jgi:hypothetical protein
MNFMKKLVSIVAHIGTESDRKTCPLYATEHPVAKGISLTAQMLEARVGR